MTGTSRYARSYIGNGVGSHLFSENVMPANWVQTEFRRWKDREEGELPKGVLWGNMAPKHKTTARHRKERMQRKNQNEKKNTWDREIEKKGGGKEKTERWEMQKAGELYGAGANILLRRPYVVQTSDRTITVFGHSFSLEVLAAGLRAGRICLRTLPVFPASGFKELQLIIEAFIVMSISSTPAKTLMLIHINRSIIMLSSFG